MMEALRLLKTADQTDDEVSSTWMRLALYEYFVGNIWIMLLSKCER